MPSRGATNDGHPLAAPSVPLRVLVLARTTCCFLAMLLFCFSSGAFLSCLRFDLFRSCAFSPWPWCRTNVQANAALPLLKSSLISAWFRSLCSSVSFRCPPASGLSFAALGPLLCVWALASATCHSFLAFFLNFPCLSISASSGFIQSVFVELLLWRCSLAGFSLSLLWGCSLAGFSVSLLSFGRGTA